MKKLKTRKDILLKACYDLLEKSSEQIYVTSAVETEIFYDGTKCDGYCLKDDIAIELGITE